MNKRIYAVLTGDLIGSSKFEPNEREEIISFLKRSFKMVEEILPQDTVVSSFEIYRGDSFQCVLSKPECGLLAAVAIRSYLRSIFKKRKDHLDARIAIGIGTIDSLPLGKSGEGDGEAFRNSGPVLDKMKKENRKTMITTPWPIVNNDLRSECALFDALADRWTNEQSHAINSKIHGRIQKEIAENIGVSQSAVFQRLKLAGCGAVQEFLDHYKTLIENAIRP